MQDSFKVLIAVHYAEEALICKLIFLSEIFQLETETNVCFVEQVFLDVVESVNILVNSNSQLVRSDVVGALKMRTYLRCGFVATYNTEYSIDFTLSV